MTTFADLGLSPSTVQAVTDTGYTQPTPIQEQAIPVALAGRDVLGIAQTGTGKTAAFTLPMIDRLKAGRAKALMPRSLVIAPTRELADQVAASFDKYAKGTRLSWALLIGGVSFGDQERKLSSGVDVLIATPGRLLDFYDRRKLMLLDVKTLVVDEADRMLDMGFIPDLERIFEITPKQKQTLFFSATMPPEITRLTGQFLKDPTRIEVSRPASTGENIKQFVVKLPLGEPKAKRMALRALIERAAPESGIIFCNRKSEVDIVAKSLQKYGFDAGPIHGDLDQSTRMKTLESFRKGELKLLVASDVAARGLDIPAVSDVFNYDVPHHADDYVHRIGRTGRAGRLGEAFMIVTPNDDRGYDKVLKLTRTEPEEIVLDLDWEEARRGAEREKERFGGRGARDGGRGRERDSRSRGRDRDRERPVADHGQRAAMEPISAPEPSEVAAISAEPAPVAPARVEPVRYSAPQLDEDRSRRDRGERDRGDRDRGRRDRGDRPRADRSERPERSEQSERPERGDRPERGGRDRYDRDDRGPRVVGFGADADTPAFLLRSAAAALEVLSASSNDEDEAPVRERPEVEVVAGDPIVVETVETRAEKPRRSRRAKPAADAVADEPIPTEPADAVAQAPIAQPDALQAVSDGKPRRARKPRAPKAAAAEAPSLAAEAPASFDAAADKPKRVRKAAPRKAKAAASETGAA